MNPTIRAAQPSTARFKFSRMERAAQPSTAQIHSLLNFLEKSPRLAKGFPKVPNARESARKTWEKLALQLNSLGGCVKTWKQWTKYWADKKSGVRKKVALHFRTKLITGEEVELSDIEERILTLVDGKNFSTRGWPLQINPYFEAQDGESPENCPSLLASTQSIDQNPVPPLPMELLIVEESEQSESKRGIEPHFAKSRESTEERPLESPISRESNTERSLSRESGSRKRTESNAESLSDSFSTSKRQHRVQNSTVASMQMEEDFTHNNDRSYEEAPSAAVECDLYGQLLAQKLKPLDEEDRLALMNDIDNLVFKHLMNIKKRSKLSRCTELQSTIQGHSDNHQSTDLSGSHSRLNQIQNGSQNVMKNSQPEVQFIVIKSEPE